MVSDLLHFRYKPKKAKFKGCKPCLVFSFFDWIIWLPDSFFTCRFRRLNPRRVLCLPNQKSFRILTKLRRNLKDSTIIIAGGDRNLSEVLPTVEGLLPYCRKIYYEAKDVPHSEIKSFSMGFASFSLKRVETKIINYFVSSVSDPTWHKKGVLASWGGVFPFLDNRLEDRRAAVEFIESCSWIRREQLEPVDYWKRLAESKYLIAPAGLGIQSPKLAEAWLMRTVPIVTDNPCFQDLQEEGFPLVIVDSWKNISKEILQEYETKRLSIEWEKVRYMLSVQFFESRYLH